MVSRQCATVHLPGQTNNSIGAFFDDASDFAQD